MREDPTPVAILRQGPNLVVTIRAALDDGQMVRFRQELSRAMGSRATTGVLIDVAALDVLDSFASRNLRDVAATAQLRGAAAVIVGVQPPLALAMVHLGIDVGAVPTALDLQAGLDIVGQPGRRDAGCVSGEGSKEGSKEKT